MLGFRSKLANSYAKSFFDEGFNNCKLSKLYSESGCNLKVASS